MQIFDYRPPAIPWLDIRYIDQDIVVINKPSGLLSNPGIASHTHDCALSRLQALYNDAILVHRLDCATSGIMVFARHKLAESRLKSQFQHRQTQKLYLAEVAGHLSPSEGTIDLPLGKDRNNPPWQKIDPVDGRSALTHYRLVEQRQDSSLVELRPETGRTHQLRVHLLALGHPILGDEFYGQQLPFGKGTVESARARLCLHAYRLDFQHPVSNKALSFTSPAPF